MGLCSLPEVDLWPHYGRGSGGLLPKAFWQDGWVQGPQPHGRLLSALPLLPPCWGSSFALGCGVSFSVESNILLSMVVQWLVAILVLPSIRVFSKESALHIRWPKYWSFSFNISPSNEHPGLISFRIDWFDLLAVQGTLKNLLQHHSSKALILWHSAFSISS